MKSYLHTKIVKFLLEKHKEELRELELEESQEKEEESQEDWWNNQEESQEKEEESQEEPTLDEVIKEYFNKNKIRKK